MTTATTPLESEKVQFDLFHSDPQPLAVKSEPPAFDEGAEILLLYKYLCTLADRWPSHRKEAFETLLKTFVVDDTPLAECGVVIK